MMWNAGDYANNGHADGPLRITDADLSRSRPPRWAWDQRIVLGCLNLLLGNEGSGKSTLVAWLIARLTLGELDGDLRHQPITVGVLGDEDSFDDVWTPRLYAAGANLARVKQIDRPDGGFVHIREDRDKLVLACQEHELRVLFFDQLLDNLGVGTDDWRQKAVRDALQPLRSVARELEIAALGCLHPNKRGGSFRELVAGAPAFNAVSRSSLLLAQHPEDENLRLLVRGKGNLSPKPNPVEFQIVEHSFEANGHTFKVPQATGFDYDGQVDIEDLFDNGAGRDEYTQLAEACEIIEALLPRDGEWHPAKRLYEACEANGIEERTARRAAERSELEHERTKTFPSSVLWRWPASPDTDRPRKSDVRTSKTSDQTGAGPPRRPPRRPKPRNLSGLTTPRRRSSSAPGPTSTASTTSHTRPPDGSSVGSATGPRRPSDGRQAAHPTVTRDRPRDDPLAAPRRSRDRANPARQGRLPAKRHSAARASPLDSRPCDPHGAPVPRPPGARRARPRRPAALPQARNTRCADKDRGMTSRTDPVAALAELVADRIHARGPDVPRVALTRQEAAGALGVSVDHFERHILAGLRVIRSGRLVLVPVAELERWAQDQAAYALQEHRGKATTINGEAKRPRAASTAEGMTHRRQVP